MPPILPHRDRLRKRRARAAATFAQHDFLARSRRTRRGDVGHIKRDFPTMLVFGGHALATPAGTTHIIRAEHDLTLDEEHLPFADNSLDAVISLLTLHWVNDLPGTLTQIRRMLKPDGLFLAILPGGETCASCAAFLRK